MTEQEKLILAVESRGVAQTNRDIDSLDSHAKKATYSFGFLKVGILAAGTAVAAGTVKLVASTRRYQDLIAQLTIATKSAEGAKNAYQALTDFAATTPYSLDQATESFIKLVNLGLTPSEKALRSYGNTASSMNKELMDFIEAVADAATGEFERLKEFGIKSSKEGDKVTFTFQGIKTTVANTAAAIEGYLQGLGDNQFAGAMEAKMKTLGGAISNLEDSWDQLFINIAKQGPDSLITSAFQAATASVDELNAQLSSGQLLTEIKAFGVLWSGVFEDVKLSAGATTDFLIGATYLWSKSGREARDDFRDTFKFLPIYATGAVQIVTAKFLQMKNDVAADFRFILDEANLAFDLMATSASVAANRISGYLSGDFKSPGVAQQLANVGTVYDAKGKARAAAYKDELDLNENIFNQVKDQIGEEANTKEKALDTELDKAQKLRDEYDAATAARKANTDDRLAQYKVGGGTEGPSAESTKKEADKAQKLLEQRLKYLEDGLLGENEVIADSYEARKEIILDSTTTTESQKKALVLQLLSESIVSETDNIRLAYETRRELILDSTQITEDAKTAMIVRLTKARDKQISDIEQATLNKRLDAASTFFGNLASVGSAFGEKGFKLAQGAAIAEATINTYKAATGAYASLAAIPYVGPALGAAAAAAAVVAGAANIAQIKSQTYQGAYEHGGQISSGRYGLVGEAGPEYVRGPAVVTSAATTRASQGSGGIRTVTIHNNGQPMQAESKTNGDELMIILTPLLKKNKEETKKELASEIRRGGSDVAKAQEETYGLRRGI